MNNDGYLKARKRMRVKGIDVSGYNYVSNYAAVAEDGIEFAILKILRKDMRPDARFEQHWHGFENAGLPIQGVYNYSYANSAAKFKVDAQRVLEVLAGRKVMVWLDLEDKSLQGLGKTLKEGIRTYAEVIQGAGLPFGIYTYQSFYNGFLAPYKDSLQYPYWVANYPSNTPITPDKDPDADKCPDIGQQLYGWQYSSKGIVKGINGDVDLDEWYVDVEASSINQPTGSYLTDGFRRELAAALGLSADATAKRVLENTVTISSRMNRYHAAVTPLERLLKEYGYYTGAVEADQGKHPIFGNGMSKATKLYQSKLLGYRQPDAEWTAKNKSYKKALQLM